MPDVETLGRSVVVGPGTPCPPPWTGCERVRVATVDAVTAEELHAAWRERRPLVIEIEPGIGLDDPLRPPPETVVGRQPWEWPVDLGLPGERLHHAVWANSVDGRRPGAPPGWRWGDEARRLGATPGGAGADVTLPDGRPAVCDGGPLDCSLPARAGVAVLHRLGLEHGSLQPMGSGEAAASALAPDQLAAVSEPRAGARIIAPAGSGKTRVLTERARHLLGGWGLPPAALALVAYNVRAAEQMRGRLTDLPGLRIRTLNALGLRLCGRTTTLEEPDVRRILSGLVDFPKRAETDPAAPWIEALGRVRLGLADPGEVEEELSDVSDLESVAGTYRRRLSDRDAVDFDEQVVGAIERLLADPAFRARSQRFARVLLIDEFQDLTPAHLLLLRLLSGPAGAVYGVGDDDQTIYGYAGATPRWLVDFERWFPGSATHCLEVNYRCPPAIVRGASNLLTRNALRVPKEIRPSGPEGETLGLEVRASSSRPATGTAQRVAELLDSGAAPADVAVLARVHASLVPVQVLLGHRGVAVEGGGERRFLQRGGVRGALAWLDVATAPEGAIPGAALREAARRPKRGMSNSLLDLIARPRRGGSLDGLVEWLDARGSGREADKVQQLARDVALVRRAASTGTTAEVLEVVRNRIGSGGLDASAAALDQWSHGAIAAHLDDLDALSELAEIQPDPAAFASWLGDRLSVPSQPGGVTVASVHAVKGREWPYVVLHHATDGLLPHRLAEDREEERRVFHVAITRASRSATIVPGSPPSPFIAELAAPGEPAVRTDPTPSRAGQPVRAGAGVDGKAPRGRRAAGSRPQAPRELATAELVEAAPGLAVTVAGRQHTIVEAGPDGAVAAVGEGPDRSLLGYGTVADRAGSAVLVARPGAGKAWEDLRAWRTSRARQLGMPPYVVFDDRTLRQLAATLPVTEASLLSVRGMGPVKSDSYGAEVIAICEAARDLAASGVETTTITTTTAGS